MLAPLEPECRWVEICGQLTDHEAGQAAGILQPRPDVKVSVSTPWPKAESVTDLNFLQFMPWLDWLSVNSLELRDVTGVRNLRQLRTLYVSRSRHKFSAEPIGNLGSSLRQLVLEGPVTHATALCELSGLITLTLRSVSMPNLDALTPMANLRGLDLKLGGTHDLSLLPRFNRLQYFEAWMIRGLADLSPLADVPSLEELHLETLKHVTELPDLHNLTRLHRITLSAMPGLANLGPLLTAPALQEVHIALGHLPPEEVGRLSTHPALRKATVGMGSKRANAAVEAALQLPPIDTPGLYPALMQGHRLAEPH
jgi:hypothetical protein